MMATDPPRIEASEPLPDRLVEAEANADEYRRLRQSIARRPQSHPIRLGEAFESLSEDEIVAAVDPLSRRQRHTRAEKEAYAKHLREHMTPAEWVLWERLEAWGADGIEIRPQEIVRGWIVDFYLPAFRIVVEVDGSVHDGGPQWQRDRHKDAVLTRDGYRVLRIRNTDVMHDADHCAVRILTLVKEAANAG